MSGSVEEKEATSLEPGAVPEEIAVAITNLVRRLEETLAGVMDTALAAKMDGLVVAERGLRQITADLKGDIALLKRRLAAQARDCDNRERNASAVETRVGRLENRVDALEQDPETVATVAGAGRIRIHGSNVPRPMEGAPSLEDWDHLLASVDSAWEQQMGELDQHWRVRIRAWLRDLVGALRRMAEHGPAARTGAIMEALEAQARRTTALAARVQELERQVGDRPELDSPDLRTIVGVHAALIGADDGLGLTRQVSGLSRAQEDLEADLTVRVQRLEGAVGDRPLVDGTCKLADRVQELEAWAAVMPDVNDRIAELREHVAAIEVIGLPGGVTADGRRMFQELADLRLRCRRLEKVVAAGWIARPRMLLTSRRGLCKGNRGQAPAGVNPQKVADAGQAALEAIIRELWGGDDDGDRTGTGPADGAGGDGGGAAADGGAAQPIHGAGSANGGAAAAADPEDSGARS